MRWRMIALLCLPLFFYSCSSSGNNSTTTTIITSTTTTTTSTSTTTTTTLNPTTSTETTTTTSSTTTVTSTTTSTTTTSLTSDFTPPHGKTSDPGSGPWNLRLMSATGTDGLIFNRTNHIITDQGDVPSIVQDNRGWIYLYYVGWTVGDEINKTVVAVSCDNGSTWVYKYLHLAGFENMVSEPVDPEIIILADGTFRLYLTAQQSGEANTSIYYAEGNDGIHFTNRGIAFSRSGKSLIDPVIILIESIWQIFTRGNTDITGAHSHGTSSDGTSFIFDEEKLFTISGEARTISSCIAVPAGYRAYAHGGAPAITSFFTTDGDFWEADSGNRLELDTSGTLEATIIKEPTVVKLSNGTYFMVYTVGIP